MIKKIYGKRFFEFFLIYWNKNDENFASELQANFSFEKNYQDFFLDCAKKEKLSICINFIEMKVLITHIFPHTTTLKRRERKIIVIAILRIAKWSHIISCLSQAVYLPFHVFALLFFPYRFGNGNERGFGNWSEGTWYIYYVVVEGVLSEENCTSFDLVVWGREKNVFRLHWKQKNSFIYFSISIDKKKLNMNSRNEKTNKNQLDNYESSKCLQKYWMTTAIWDFECMRISMFINKFISAILTKHF